MLARGEFVNNQLQGLGIKEQVPIRATNLIPHWITKRSVKWIGNFQDSQLKGLHVKIDTLTHRTFYQVPKEVVEQYSLYYQGIFEKDKLQGPGEIFSIGENNKASIKGVFEQGRLVGEVEITYPDGSSEKCDADSEICRNTLDMVDFYNVIRQSKNDVPKIYRPTK